MTSDPNTRLGDEAQMAERHKWIDLHLSSFEHYSTMRGRAYGLAFLGAGALFTIGTSEGDARQPVAILLLLLGAFCLIAIAYINRLIRSHWSQLDVLLDMATESYPAMTTMREVASRFHPQKRFPVFHVSMSVLAGAVCWVPALILLLSSKGVP